MYGNRLNFLAKQNFLLFAPLEHCMNMQESWERSFLPFLFQEGKFLHGELSAFLKQKSATGIALSVTSQGQHWWPGLSSLQQFSRLFSFHCFHRKKICSISSRSRVLVHRPCPKLDMFCPSVLQLFYGCSKVLMTNHGVSFFFFFFFQTGWRSELSYPSPWPCELGLTI